MLKIIGTFFFLIHFLTSFAQAMDAEESDSSSVVSSVSAPEVSSSSEENHDTTIEIPKQIKEKKKKLIISKIFHRKNTTTPFTVDQLPEDMLGVIFGHAGHCIYQYEEKRDDKLYTVNRQIILRTIPMVCKTFQKIFEKFAYLPIENGGWALEKGTGIPEIKPDPDKVKAQKEIKKKTLRNCQDNCCCLQGFSIFFTSALSLMSAITNCVYIDNYNGYYRNCFSNDGLIHMFRENTCSEIPGYLQYIRKLELGFGAFTSLFSFAMFANTFASCKLEKYSKNPAREYPACVTLYGITPSMILGIGAMLSVFLNCSTDPTIQYVGACTFLITCLAIVPLSFAFSWVGFCMPSCQIERDKDNGRYHRPRYPASTW